MPSSAGGEGYLAERADGSMYSFGRSDLGTGDCIVALAGRDDLCDRIARGFRPWARVADAHVFHPQLMAATAMLEKLQKYFNALNEAVLGKRLGTAPFSMIAGHLAPELRTIPTREQMSDTLAQSAAEIMLSHVSALSHSGSTSDRKEIIGRDGFPFGKSWFEDDPEGATWPGHHMAGGVAVPLKPKTKIVWGKRPHVDDKGDVDPGASSSGQPRTEPAPDRGAGSGKDDDVTLPDIGKLSVTEKKKDDMDVDQEGSKKDSTGTKEPTPRGY